MENKAIIRKIFKINFQHFNMTTLFSKQNSIQECKLKVFLEINEVHSRKFIYSIELLTSGIHNASTKSSNL